MSSTWRFCKSSAETTQSSLTAVISLEDEDEEEDEQDEDSSDLRKMSGWGKMGSLSEISSLWLSFDTNCIFKDVESELIYENHLAMLAPTENAKGK